MKRTHYPLIFFVYVVLLIAMASIPVSATTYNIYPTDPDNVSDIMSNQAQPGDTLFFHAGTYSASGTGTSYINVENVTWKGEGANVVIFDGSDIQLKKSGCVLDGFQVVNAPVDVHVYAINCVIRNCVFESLSSKDGLPIESDNCLFENNIVSNSTGEYCAFHIEANNCTVVNNTFTNNLGAGVSLYDVDGCIVTNNNISYNDYAGIEFYETTGTNTIYGNNIIGNGVAATTTGTNAPSFTYWNSTKPMEYTYNGVDNTSYMGNYYDDYTGSDTDADGIGDTSNYTVPDSLGIDYAPLITGIENYSVIGEVPDPTVLSFDLGTGSIIEEKESQIQIMADAFPRGLSKYNLTVNIDNPGAIKIRGITYPSWASDTENSSLSGTSIYLKAYENGSAVQKGAKNVVLATLNVYGKEFGTSANISIGVEELKDDSSDTIETTNETGKLKVTMKALPIRDSSLEDLQEGDFYTSSPQNVDGDEYYEDLNGDGKFSFGDIVIYFHDMSWIEKNLPIQYFDFNGNNNIDFDDVRTMFNKK